MISFQKNGGLPDLNGLLRGDLLRLLELRPDEEPELVEVSPDLSSLKLVPLARSIDVRRHFFTKFVSFLFFNLNFCGLCVLVNLSQRVQLLFHVFQKLSKLLVFDGEPQNFTLSSNELLLVLARPPHGEDEVQQDEEPQQQENEERLAPSETHF